MQFATMSDIPGAVPFICTHILVNTITPAPYCKQLRRMKIEIKLENLWLLKNEN